MSPPRKFDWDEAARLRAEGLSYQAVADRLGVSPTAVWFAVKPETRRVAQERMAAWQRAGVCPDCGAPATRAGGGVQRRCQACAAKAATTSARDGELLCFGCREWKTDVAFPRSVCSPPGRRGRHSFCRRCGTSAKRQWREQNQLVCSGCGTNVSPGNQRDKTKPPLCRHCYVLTLRRKRQAA